MESTNKCGVCDKVYKTTKGLNKHLLLHKQNDTQEIQPVQNGDDPNLNPIEFEDDRYEWPELAFLGEEEDVDDADLINGLISDGEPETSAEPPSKKRRKNATEKQRKQPLEYCSICKGKGFVSIDGFVKHNFRHAMEGAFARAPTVDKIIENSSRLSVEVLSDIQNCGYAGAENGQRSLEHVQVLQEEIHNPLWEQFLKVICGGLFTCFQSGKNFVMPSHMRAAFVRNAGVFAVNLVARNKLIEILKLLLNNPSHDLNLLLSTFLRRFSNKVLALILSLINYNESKLTDKDVNDFEVTYQSTDSADFIQNMHYIGGSNVKSVLRNCLKLKHPSDDIVRILNTIKNNFVVGDLSEAPETVLMEWTNSRDRGGLTKISASALEFFVNLGKIVNPLEHKDGSLVLDEVTERVVSSAEVVQLWDNIINNSLSGEESLHLLYALCHYFCVTWRKGIITRRKDELDLAKRDKHGTGGVGFRPRLL